MKGILFVDSNESFVIRGISDNLKKENYNVSTMPLDRSVLSKIEVPAYIFVSVYEDFEENLEEYKYLNELCAGGARKVFLLGFEEDVEKAKIIFDKASIAECFLRPANAGYVAQVLKDILENGDGSRKKKHILLVDDSGTLLNALKGWLEDDYKVSMVNSALNAIFFLSGNLGSVDLILLDYSMPICSGATLFEMLRSDAKTKSIPVIFLTGVEEQEVMDETLRLNPEGYLLKSMSREGILSQIEAFFDREDF